MKFRTLKDFVPAEVKELLLTDIVIDPNVQPRVALDLETANDYARDMTEGDVFPNLGIFFINGKNILAAGNHRYEGAIKALKPSYPCDIYHGTIEDAQEFALLSNRTNGKRLSRADTVRAIKMALAIYPNASDRELGRMIGCDHKTIGAYRAPRPAETATPPDGSRPNENANGSRPAADVETPPLPGMEGMVQEATPPTEPPAPAAGESPQPDDATDPMPAATAATPPFPGMEGIVDTQAATAPQAPAAPKLKTDVVAFLDKIKTMIESGKYGEFVDQLERIAEYVSANNSIPQGSRYAIAEIERPTPAACIKPNEVQDNELPTHDMQGMPIPENLRLAFAAWSLLNSLAQEMYRLKTLVTHYAVTEEVKGFQALDLKTFEHHAQCSFNVLRSGLPFAVCTKCEGGKCGHCGNRGWVTEKWQEALEDGGEEIPADLSPRQAQVFKAIKSFGKGGATQEEISERSGIPRASVSGRIPELRALGLIEEPEGATRATASGRPAQVIIVSGGESK